MNAVGSSRRFLYNFADPAGRARQAVPASNSLRIIISEAVPLLSAEYYGTLARAACAEPGGQCPLPIWLRAV